MTWVSGHPQKLWDSSWTPPNLRHLWFIAFIVDICAQRNRTQQQWQRITCKLRRCNAASDKCTQHVQNFVTYLHFGVNKLQWRTDQRYYSPDYNIFDTDGQYQRYYSPGYNIFGQYVTVTCLTDRTDDVIGYFVCLHKILSVTNLLSLTRCKQLISRLNYGHNTFF